MSAAGAPPATLVSVPVKLQRLTDPSARSTGPWVRRLIENRRRRRRLAGEGDPHAQGDLRALRVCRRDQQESPCGRCDVHRRRGVRGSAWPVWSQAGCGDRPTADSLSQCGLRGERCSGPSAGGPGSRRLVSCFLAASLRCQASRVAGVTRKMPARCLQVSAAPARRTIPGRPARIVSARRAGVARCSHAGVLQLNVLGQVPAECQDREAEYPANQ